MADAVTRVAVESVVPFDVYLNVAIGGVLTGLVYGLMALGLSVIFGVVRVVNFAHGEMMTIAMFIAVVLCTGLHLDPLILLVPIAAVMFVFGYVLQRGLINLFVTRPEHSQFLLLVAVALIIANALLIVFGPDARSVQTAYGYESFQIGPMIVDAAKVYAGAVAIVVTAVLFAFFRLTLVGKAIRACADNHTGALVIGLDVKRLYALTFGIGAACVGAAGTMLVLLFDATPMWGRAIRFLPRHCHHRRPGIDARRARRRRAHRRHRSACRSYVHAVDQEHVCLRHSRAGAVVPFARHSPAGRLHDPTPDRRSVAARHCSAYAASGGVPRGAVDRRRLSPHHPDHHSVFRLYRAGLEHRDGICWTALVGHALYLGLGGYVAAILFTQFGIGPWLGLLAAMPVAAAGGAIIGFLAFRFGVAGVYFAILTIAFAEFARIGFDNWNFVNGSGGLFLPVKQYAHNDLWRLRGDPTMFYYVILAATVAVFALCRFLIRSRVGFFWLAIREDEQAARAAGIDTFRYKMYAVMTSAAVTSFAGVFYAFFYNNLFPEQVFGISRSIEIILGPIIGGVGTLFGPIVGAFVLTGLAEALSSGMSASGIDLPGAKQISYGICLLIVIVAMPNGVWPPLHVGSASERPTNDGAADARRREQALSRLGCGRSGELGGAARRDLRRHRPERCRQDDAVQHDAAAMAPDTGSIRFAGKEVQGCRPTPSAGAASPAPFRSCGRFRHSASRTTSSSARCCIGAVSTTHAHKRGCCWRDSNSSTKGTGSLRL